MLLPSACAAPFCPHFGADITYLGTHGLCHKWKELELYYHHVVITTLMLLEALTASLKLFRIYLLHSYRKERAYDGSLYQPMLISRKRE